MKLCKCGRIVKDKCEYCYPKRQHDKTTKERGYGHDWRKLSERKRTEDPLCERCLEQGKVTPAEHVHHKQKIRNAPHLRLDWNNLVSVCKECHEEMERLGLVDEVLTSALWGD